MTRGKPILLAMMAMVVCQFLCSCGRISATEQPEAEAVDLPRAALGDYARNCSACHGANGVNGAAQTLADANYLASVGREALIRITTNGVPGGFCPGSGPDSLARWSPSQVEHFVDGLLQSWGANGVASQIPWSVKSAPVGIAHNGRAVYESMCQSCHGAPGFKGVSPAGSVTDPNYVRLKTDQGLRSAVLFGRASRGMPGWSGPFPNQAAARTLSSQEISDVVAFLRSMALQSE